VQTLEELATPAVSLQKWKFQENSHMLETISGSIKFSLSLSLSLSLSFSAGSKQRSREAKEKRAQSLTQVK
jgi:hypothetical protein